MPNKPIVPEDPFGVQRKGKERPGVSARESMAMHRNADTDSSWDALHHTLGGKSTQAAAGDHGHTHNSEAIGYAVKRDTTWTHNPSTWQIMPFGTMEWENPVGQYNTSTNQYTIPVTGIWLFMGVYIPPAFTTTAHKLIGLFVGGATEIARSGTEINTTGTQGASLSLMRSFTVGEQIGWYAWQDNAGAGTASAFPSSHWGAILIKAL